MLQAQHQDRNTFLLPFFVTESASSCHEQKPLANVFNISLSDVPFLYSRYCFQITTSAQQTSGGMVSATYRLEKKMFRSCTSKNKFEIKLPLFLKAVLRFINKYNRKQSLITMSLLYDAAFSTFRAIATQNRKGKSEKPATTVFPSYIC